MSLTKQDKKEIGEIVRDEVIDAVANGIQPTLDRLEGKINHLAQNLESFKQETKNNFMGVHRQISDLKIDIPTRTEFAGHEKRIHRLEKHLSFV